MRGLSILTALFVWAGTQACEGRSRRSGGDDVAEPPSHRDDAKTESPQPPPPQVPTPGRAPASLPTPMPEPTPGAEPAPTPEPTPAPDPTPDPAPTPLPSPEPIEDLGPAVAKIFARLEYGPCTSCHSAQAPKLTTLPTDRTIRELVVACVDQTDETACNGDPADSTDNVDEKMPSRYGFDPVSAEDLAVLRRWAAPH